MSGRRAGADRRSVAEKLFAIADAFDGVAELSLTELADRAELPLTTAHRLVGAWVAWGGLVRGDDGLYRLGLKVWRLGVRQPSARRLRGVARPYLGDLLEATREHVHLAVRDGLGVVYLERLSGRDSVPVVSDVGTRLPLHATAVGQVLLAFAPNGTLEDVLARGPRRFMPNTLTTEHELRSRLADIRRKDLARSVEELTEGAFSVAAPVRDAAGGVVAAVSVIARVEHRDQPHYALGVRMAARGISAGLGFRA